MGTGIVGFIPLNFSVEKDYNLSYKKYFCANYFDYYYENNSNNKNILFTINKDIFVNNYIDFLLEFYNAIGEDFYKNCDLDKNSELLKINNFDNFILEFNKDKRNSFMPFIENDGRFISVLSAQIYSCWLIYNGSFKAYLEDYSTLFHMENLTSKLLKNPLGKIVKFGLFG
jgi:hypothetical protein